jgi:hypothetical protein
VPRVESSLITVEPSSASPGESVVVTGENFFRGCSDASGSNSTPGMDPELGIQVEFRQGSQSWPLATVDARANYSFDEVVEVPGTATGKWPGGIAPPRLSQNRT